MASVYGDEIILVDEEEVQDNGEEEKEQQQKQEEAIMMTPEKSKDGDVLFVGRCFDSIQDAEKAYKDFGHRNGFSTRIRTSYTSKEKEKEVLAVLFVCGCEGKHKPQKKSEDAVDGKLTRRTSTIRTDCHAKMRVKLCPSYGWICSIFDNEHNHGMVSPDKRNLMRSRRVMPESAKDLLGTLRMVNVQASKVVEFYGDEPTFDKRDVWNHMRWLRKIHYEDKDANAVKNYFMHMAANDPQFFYAIQCDDEGRAANFFWVNADAREAYRQFGDAVTFDTTYRTNKYCMPFAPFTGVNHHRQSILFGCALLENEQEYTFLWLFETWLQAMGGNAPISIITDQDVAMGNAIARVFPNTRHRLCLWHIKKKFGEKLGAVYAKRSNFKRAVKRCTRGEKLAYQVAHQCGESEIGYKKFKDCLLQMSVEAQEINEMMLQQDYNGKVDSHTVIVDSCTDEPGVVGTAASRVDAVLSNPNISITKGRKRTANQEMGSQVEKRTSNQDMSSQVDKEGRWKGGMEIATGKKLRRCRYCSKLVDHDIRNCPLRNEHERANK